MNKVKSAGWDLIAKANGKKTGDELVTEREQREREDRVKKIIAGEPRNAKERKRRANMNKRLAARLARDA